MIIVLDNLDTAKHRKKAGDVRLKPIRPSMKAETTFNKSLNREIAAMIKEVQPIAARQIDLKTKYNQLWAALDKWQKHFDNFGMVESTALANTVFDNIKTRLVRDITEKMRVNIEILFEDAARKAAIEAAAIESASLIKTIPQKYFGEVTRAVLTAVKQQPLPEGRTLYQQLQHIGGVTKTRAKFIARDQTAKVTSAITEYQQSEAGLETYQWITSRDERVVGKPGGRYPKGSKIHGNHYKMDGKYCKWSDSTIYSDDGKKWKKRTGDMTKSHPGQDIGCRCIAGPILDRRKIA